MLAALLLILAIPEDAPARCLDAAEQAAKAGRTEESQRWLRAWATLEGQGERELLRAGAAEAKLWARGAGLLRLFASRTEGRLRVGLHDPARLVTRVTAQAKRDGQTSSLPRLEEAAPDRIEFELDPAHPEDLVIEVLAEATIAGKTVVVQRVVLLGGPPPIPPPSPGAAAFRDGSDVPSAQRSEPEAALSWWIVLVGVAATGILATAIAQEAAQ